MKSKYLTKLAQFYLLGSLFFYCAGPLPSVKKKEAVPENNLTLSLVKKEEVAPEKDLAGLLKEGRKDCDRIEFSQGSIRCYKEYLTDEESMIIEPDPSGTDGYDDGITVEDILVWELRPKDCRDLYYAGVGKVILELSNGWVWEFKYDNPEKAKKAAGQLGLFCEDKK